MSSRFAGEGRAKLILLGEHSVVYGQPALVLGLSRGAEVSIEPRTFAGLGLTLRDANAQIVEDGLESAHAREPLARAIAAIDEAIGGADPGGFQVDAQLFVPPGAGLGSSAALAAALARALSHARHGALRQEAIERAVASSEAVFHGNPSGIDQAAALRGGLLWFQRHEEGVELRSLERSTLRLSICLTGPGASTARMVEGVGQRLHRHRPVMEQTHGAIGALVAEGAEVLARQDLESFGELMDINHGLLSALGVSTPRLDEACHLAREVGALGAKLTGSGGGGCAYALTPGAELAAAVCERWRQAGFEAFEATSEG